MKQLQSEFEGTGEMRGFSFKQIRSGLAYIYEVEFEGCKHYEVFKHIENERFNTVSYPTVNAFGIWAWVYHSYSKAVDKYTFLVNESTIKATKKNEMINSIKLTQNV